MRKSLLFLGLIMLAIPMNMQARSFNRRFGNKAENFHFGYVSTAVGYTSISQKINTATTTGNVGYLFGAGYEFRRSSFWLSVGAQYMQEKSKTQLEQDIQLRNGIDDQGYTVEYYRYKTNQTDQQIWRTVDVPILLGYYYDGFYVGAGAKVGFSMGSVIIVNGGYALSAKYDHMPEEMFGPKYYKQYELPESTFDCKLRPQFSLIGEIGYDVLSSIPNKSGICHMLKVGFYFEYGLRSVRNQVAMDPISIDGLSIEEARAKKVDIRKATLNPYYLSTATAGKRVIPYFVGVKLTYMIGGNRYASGTWHKGCQCYK